MIAISRFFAFYCRDQSHRVNHVHILLTCHPSTLGDRKSGEELVDECGGDGEDDICFLI